MRDLPAPTPDAPTLAALRRSFEALTPDVAPRWGRMRAAQMTKHCRVFVELCLGRVPISWPVRALARTLGPLFLRRLMAKPPTEGPKNLGTLPPLRADDAESLDLDDERRALFAVFDELESIDDPHRHPLYGPMRPSDVINLVRYHTTHHANQFGLLAAK